MVTVIKKLFFNLEVSSAILINFFGNKFDYKLFLLLYSSKIYILFLFTTSIVFCSQQEKKLFQKTALYI